MSKRSINIERLQIRLRGVSPQAARAATKDLGAELLGQLASHAEASKPGRTIAIGKVDAGRFVVDAGTTPAGLRKVITHRIADSIKTKLR